MAGEQDSTFVDLAGNEWDSYLSVALSAKDVTPAERAKLKGLLKHYAKMKHPFTACVRDNTKRFGRERAERICAVLKDIMKGTTKWRNNEGSKLSEAAQSELFALSVDAIDVAYMLDLADQIEGSDVPEDTADSSEPQGFSEALAEIYLADGATEIDDDGLIWKTIMREGKWRFSPGPGQRPQAKPITVRASGASDPKALVISLEELVRNFEAGAVEHVTVPTTHEDKVLDNTGYIRRVRLGKDEQGRTTLEGAIEFTEPEVKEKAKRGTIANISAGVLFDYVKKDTGDKFNAVMAHAALTNHPWLNGMKPFGVEASDDMQIFAFAEEVESAESGGGEEVSDTNKSVELNDELRAAALAELGFSSVEEARAAREENERLRREARENSIKDKVKKWEDDKKPPAMVSLAADLLRADDGDAVLNLSEEGREVSLSASDIVERLMASAPVVNLSEDPPGSTERDASADSRPEDDASTENEMAGFSTEEKAEVVSLTLEEGLSKKDAIERIKTRRQSDKDN